MIFNYIWPFGPSPGGGAKKKCAVAHPIHVSLTAPPHPSYWWEARHIDVWFAWQIPNLSMYHLVHTHQDIKRRKTKIRTQQYKETECQSKGKSTVKPWMFWPKTPHQAPTLSSTDKSLSRNRHRAGSPTHRRSLKRKAKLATMFGLTLSQYINVIYNLFIMRQNLNKLHWKMVNANNFL